MFETLDACAEAWKRAGNHGDKACRIARNLRWMRYYAQINDPTRSGEAEIDPHAAEVVDLLFHQGLLTPESSVLDIGSGSGTYALAFAARGCKVTAMDMDPNALRILQTHAEQLHLNRITCREQMWEDVLPDTRYSFVFTSMCPAICDDHELLRMQALSDHARANDPFAEVGKMQVAVDVSSVIRASRDSFRIAWIERRYQDGSLVETSRWSAILTTSIQPPRTPDALRRNPLGVFVTAISWSKELSQ